MDLIPWFTPGDLGDVRDLVKSIRYLSEEGLSRVKRNYSIEKCFWSHVSVILEE